MKNFKNKDATEIFESKYELVFLAAKRAKDLARGDIPLIKGNHGPCVTALKEIEQGLITKAYLKK